MNHSQGSPIQKPERRLAGGNWTYRAADNRRFYSQNDEDRGIVHEPRLAHWNYVELDTDSDDDAYFIPP